MNNRDTFLNNIQTFVREHGEELAHNKIPVEIGTNIMALALAAGLISKGPKDEFVVKCANIINDSPET
jgi:hypothetical protein